MYVKSFYIPGTYVAQPEGHRMRGGLYVENWQDKVTQPHPIVMIHGGGQNGTCYTTKPDGGDGWAQYFARRGFSVYVIDEPARGRSPYGCDLDGPIRSVLNADITEKIFTATAVHKLWPSAERHTQWPGAGRRGDPIFDRFYASQSPMLTDGEAMEKGAAAAVVGLLRQIGPAILLTHSQGGPRGWLAADAAPELVKGIAAIEPMGSAFYWTVELAAALGIPPNTICHPFGICSTRITYEPPVDDPAPLLQWQKPENKGRWRLPNLAKVPVAIFSGEASYHRSSDLDLMAYLTAMGVTTRLVLLEDIGIRGNGHMMMLERNSDAIAQAIIDAVAAWR
jgi:pimeloyl-ACP methyl ester carboxylesterase